MTRLLYVLLSTLPFLFASNLVAQTVDDKFAAPVIEDEMTADPEQNKMWRTGQAVYSAKPKNMWELGIHAGPAFVSGDVEAPFPAGYGFGLHLRKALNYTFSIRFDGAYQSSKGYDARPASAFGAERIYYQNNGSSPALEAYAVPGAIYHRNYKADILMGSLEGLINIGNVLFHKPSNRTNFYIIAGLGLNMPRVYSDLLDGSGNPYDFTGVADGNNQTIEQRKNSRNNLKDLLDGDFETRGGIEKDIISLGDNKTLIPHFNVGMGLSKKLSRRINLSIEHKVMLSDNDLLDAYEYRTLGDETNSNDFAHYTSVRLGINLGSFEKRVEPLYWVNPLDGPFNDIAELKQRPKFDLTDSDGDGVIDMTDQEINTPAGCPVDTRGVTLDSDGDNIADCKDQEPYSPPGFEVDNNGVAQVPDNGYLTEEEVVNIINTRGGSNFSWFLPMIHFDLNKYYVKPEFYGSLHQVASVMNSHPDLKVVAHGFTDNRSSDGYNNVLSYNRANAAINYLVENYNIPRSRFILSYGGEQAPIVKNLPDSHNVNTTQEYKHYINRRVEFRVATATDTDMSRPAGPEAGENTPGSSRPGSKYSGNRNSG
ncbi:MAG: OmpA family protein, partial [Bacteroidota bacterium]|nr:OmpA family protein [Bacteroidota bacterium]